MPTVAVEIVRVSKVQTSSNNHTRVLKTVVPSSHTLCRGLPSRGGCEGEPLSDADRAAYPANLSRLSVQILSATSTNVDSEH